MPRLEYDTTDLMTPILGMLMFIALFLAGMAAFSQPPRYDPNVANKALTACFDGATKLQNQVELNYERVINLCTNYAKTIATKEAEQ